MYPEGPTVGQIPGNKRDAPDVNIAENLAIPRIFVGRFMESQLIGNHDRAPKPEAIKPVLSLNPRSNK